MFETNSMHSYMMMPMEGSPNFNSPDLGQSGYHLSDGSSHQQLETPSPSASLSPELQSNNRRQSSGNRSRHSQNRGKSKRVRTIFTPEQLKRLEQEFSNQMYLVGDDRGYLANSLRLTEAQVKVWFQNRRIKHRKMNPGPMVTVDVDGMS